MGSALKKLHLGKNPDRAPRHDEDIKSEPAHPIDHSAGTNFARVRGPTVPPESNMSATTNPTVLKRGLDGPAPTTTGRGADAPIGTAPSRVVDTAEPTVLTRGRT